MSRGGGRAGSYQTHALLRIRVDGLTGGAAVSADPATPVQWTADLHGVSPVQWQKIAMSSLRSG
jgi:hypothetical protein